MKLFQRFREPDLMPAPGDTVVTLTVDPSQPFEQRINLLSYAFVKVVQGSCLKQVLRYDLKNGVVRFIVSGPVCPEPRGHIEAEVEGFSGEYVLTTSPAS